MYICVCLFVYMDGCVYMYVCMCTCICMCVYVAATKLNGKIHASSSPLRPPYQTTISPHHTPRRQRLQDSIVAQAVEVALTYVRPMQVNNHTTNSASPSVCLVLVTIHVY
jgi:hypothetical protein